MRRRALILTSSLLLAASLTGCLWGLATIGGTLSGLPSGTSVTLQNNGTDNLTLRQNGAFEFAGTVDENKPYSVTVLTQPNGGTCTVANGSGTVDAMGTDVTNISVTCVVDASITGTVSGLASGTSVTLLNAGTSLVVGANGSFAFPGILSNGTAYNVSISVYPSGQTCSLANATGTVVTGTPTNVTVTCS